MKQHTGAFRVLVLTDHTAHNASNSVYDLCRSLVGLPDIAEVSVASRGNPGNAGFFYQHTTHKLMAHAVGPNFTFENAEHLLNKDCREVEPEGYQWIWLRLPRPIASGFFPWLCTIFPENRIVNRPSGISETSSKAFLLSLQRWCPEMHLCHTVQEIEDLQRTYPIVLKPLEGYGGQGIVRISNGQVLKGNIVIPLEEYFQQINPQLATWGFLAMRYLKNVRRGDKRIVVVDGQVIGAALRRPAAGSWMCNASQGGVSEYAFPDARELEMIEDVNGVLREKGIIMYGIDTLEGDDGVRMLSEINTLSIGGIAQIAAHAGLPLVDVAAERLVGYFRRGLGGGRPREAPVQGGL